VEIFCALLPGLGGHGDSAEALIAEFERRQRTDRLRACSACAGDYEDPDRTAWSTAVEEEEGEEPPAATDESPARQQ